MKIFKSVLALAVLSMFVACGDDSSSSVSPEPAEESSSSVIPASSGNLQSSSSKDLKNSSSSEEKAKESSSSVKPSSSSEAKSSSSEEVKQSSSSVVASSSSVVGESSSSEYKPYNHQKVFSSDSLLSGAYKEFTDERNGRKYYYLTINGEDKDGNPASVTVMAENLNIGIDVAGGEDQVDDSKIERYCYNDDTTNCDKYGGLYQWAEAMQLPSECNAKSCADQIKPNHRGICPEGWRLLTYDDFYIVVHADGNRHGVEDVRAMGFGGYNYSGYSLIGAGYNWGYKFSRKDESTYWHYPEEGRSNDVNIASFVGYQTKSSTANSTQDTYKTHGFSIRCVMAE